MAIKSQLKYSTKNDDLSIEGTSEEELNDYVVFKYADSKGYLVEKIDIVYDELKKVWKFVANIIATD